MSFEQILFLAVFVLVPLLNLLRRALARHAQRAAPPELAPTAPDAAAEQPLRVSSARTRPGPVRGQSTSAQTPPTQVSGARRRPRVHLRGAHEVRRAVILMAVLGPCRGRELP
jgi:hypothetical protein